MIQERCISVTNNNRLNSDFVIEPVTTEHDGVKHRGTLLLYGIKW